MYPRIFDAIEIDYTPYISVCKQPKRPKFSKDSETRSQQYAKYKEDVAKSKICRLEADRLHQKAIENERQKRKQMLDVATKAL